MGYKLYELGFIDVDVIINQYFFVFIFCDCVERERLRERYRKKNFLDYGLIY